MRYFLVLSVALIFIIGSCKKTSGKTNNYPIIPDGTYTGTFQRQTSTGGQIANVTIIFSDSTWSGQSDVARYPALCHGNYNIIGKDSVSFNNACMWTADFDWSFILSFNYKIKISGKELELSRNELIYKDIYKLTKQ